MIGCHFWENIALKLHVFHWESHGLGLFVFPKNTLDALELLLEQASIISVGIAFYLCYQGGTVNVVEGDDVYLVVAFADPVMTYGGNSLFLANLLAEVLLQYQTGVVIIVSLNDFKQ